MVAPYNVSRNIVNVRLTRQRKDIFRFALKLACRECAWFAGFHLHASKMYSCIEDLQTLSKQFSMYSLKEIYERWYYIYHEVECLTRYGTFLNNIDYNRGTIPIRHYPINTANDFFNLYNW